MEDSWCTWAQRYWDIGKVHAKLFCCSKIWECNQQKATVEPGEVPGHRPHRPPLTHLEQMQERLPFGISRYHCLHRFSCPAEQACKGQWGHWRTAGADMHSGFVLRSSSLLFSLPAADFHFMFWDKFSLDHAKIWDEFFICGMLSFLCGKARVVLMLKIQDANSEFPSALDFSECDLLQLRSVLEDGVQADWAHVDPLLTCIWSKTSFTCWTRTVSHLSPVSQQREKIRCGESQLLSRDPAAVWDILRSYKLLKKAW